MEKLPWLPVSEIFYAAYFSFYVMVAGIGFVLYFQEERRFWHYVSVVSFVFYGCYLAFIFLPVVGSRVFYAVMPGFDHSQFSFFPLAFPAAVQAGPLYQIGDVDLPLRSARRSVPQQPRGGRHLHALLLLALRPEDSMDTPGRRDSPVRLDRLLQVPLPGGRVRGDADSGGPHTARRVALPEDLRLTDTRRRPPVRDSLVNPGRR